MCAMHQLEDLLILRFDRNACHIPSTNGFKHSGAIGGIGLVTANVGTHILRGQQAHALHPIIEEVPGLLKLRQNVLFLRFFCLGKKEFNFDLVLAALPRFQQPVRPRSCIVQHGALQIARRFVVRLSKFAAFR